METQESLNYHRIEKAIGYIREHFKQQPPLDEIANFVGLSPTHFQRLFTDWAGISPKRFLQFISIEHAKNLLRETSLNLFHTTSTLGLSSTSRLHDLFVSIEGMTPAAYKNQGSGLSISYAFHSTPFGLVLIASTPKGICRLVFISDEKSGVTDLQRAFPKAKLIAENNQFHEDALKVFANNRNEPSPIKLHLKGTPFQLKVWEALLKIPPAQLTTYGALADHLEMPNASRAVGTAIGKNPIAFLIPCHRVIRSNGFFEGYAWGTNRKTAIIGWENAQIER